MLKRKEIGIDLGSNSIKIAIIDKTSINTSIYDSDNPDLSYLGPHEVYQVDCEPYSEEYYKLLKASLKKFAKKNKLGLLSLNISIPVDNITNSTVMFINMPAVNDKVLKDGINFEAEQEMALNNVVNSYHTWKIIDKYDELNEYKIMLATMREDIVNALSKFKTINWKVNRLMLQPIVLERIVSNDDVIIDFGHHFTKIYLYEQGKLKQTELIQFGGKTIIETIEKHLEENNIENKDVMELAQSIYVKNDFIENFKDSNSSDINDDDYSDYISELEIPELEKGESFGNDILQNELLEKKNLINDLVDLFKDKIMFLTDEIKRIIRTYELQNGLSIENVYYIGGLSNMKYLKEFVGAELNMSLKSINIIAGEEDNDCYSIAGLTSMDPELNDDTNFSKFIKANIDYASISIATLAIILSVGLSLKVMDTNYSEMITNLTSIRTSQETTLGEINNDIISVQDEIVKNADFINKIKDLKNEKKWLSDILYMVPNMTPTTVAIKDMSISSNNIIIQGYSSNYSSIGFFVKKLERLGEVNIDSISEYSDEDGNIYSVSMDKPELISDKFKITQSFTLSLTYNDTLIEH